MEKEVSLEDSFRTLIVLGVDFVALENAKLVPPMPTQWHVFAAFGQRLHEVTLRHPLKIGGLLPLVAQSKLCFVAVAEATPVFSARSSWEKEYRSMITGPEEEQLEIASSKGPESGLSWENFRNMKYSWNVVCEVLRLYTPGSGFREAITDFTYEGYTIPKGWKLHWTAQGSHKNPEYFPNPEKFDPTRFEGDGPAPYTYIPFGRGPRMFPGNEFAKVEILTFIHYVVTSFKWEQINPDEKLSYFPLTRPVEGLPIRLYPRNARMNYQHQS